MTAYAIPTQEFADIQAAAELLGGARVLRHSLRSPIDAHEMLLKGLPGQALNHLLGRLVLMKMSGPLEKAVGMSLRTYQRRKESSARRLSLEQSGRTWKFAEVLARAIAVFGSQEEAEQWLERPAVGLDQRRPIDLLATPTGVELVETYLQQMKYGVYV